MFSAPFKFVLTITSLSHLQAAAAAAEAFEAASWEKGAKKDKNAAKQAELDAKMARKAEDAAMLAAEESVFSNMAGGKKKSVGKSKGKDDFSLLDAALKAAPKTKAQKVGPHELCICYSFVMYHLCGSNDRRLRRRRKLRRRKRKLRRKRQRLVLL